MAQVRGDLGRKQPQASLRQIARQRAKVENAQMGVEAPLHGIRLKLLSYGLRTAAKNNAVLDQILDRLHTEYGNFVNHDPFH